MKRMLPGYHPVLGDFANASSRSAAEEQLGQLQQPNGSGGTGDGGTGGGDGDGNGSGGSGGGGDGGGGDSGSSRNVHGGRSV